MWMNVYITMDMEGISGITTGDMTRSGSAEWAQRGRHLATADVNAAIEGALEAGAKRIWVQDMHDSGETILRDNLNPAAELITGCHAVVGHMPGLDGSFDAVFLVGFHAMMGSRFAHFDHTISTACISQVRFNGRPVGELGIFGGYAGCIGVPVALVTGDVAATEEAAEFFGDVTSVAVKQGLGRFATRSLHPEATQAAIREAAKLGLRRPNKIYKPDVPLTIAVDTLRSAEADQAEILPGARRTGPRTVEYTNEAWEMAFRGLQTIVSLAGLAASRWAAGLYSKGNPVI
jgi:D-amino peptidase